MHLEPSGRPVQQILDDALAGRRISAGDAHTLLLDGDLLDLGMAAHEVRNRFNDPAVATYNVDRNINYTNICVYKCRFCAFCRAPGDPEGYLLPFEEIGRKVEETLALNGTGILMQGACTPTCRSPSTRTCSATCAPTIRPAISTPSRRRRSSS